MKILFDNLLKGATFSSVNASANYPVKNLDDGFLRLRYQANVTGDSVTIITDEQIALNSIYLSYIGNVDDIEISFFAGDAIQLVTLGPMVATGDGNIIVTGDGSTMHFASGPSDYFTDYAGERQISRHFEMITGVDKITIDLLGDNPFYIGGVAAGLAEDIPPALAAWDDTYNDESAVSRSSHGQVQALYIEPAMAYTFSFEGVSMSDFTRIKAAAQAAGPVPVWVTFFEDTPEAIRPGYYQVAMTGAMRSAYTYSFQLSFTEAK